MLIMGKMNVDGFSSVPIPFAMSDTLEKAIAIVSWVDTHIERRIWTPSEINKKFGKRSASEILREGHIHYYDPCVDLDSVIAYLMKEAGLQPSFVIFRSSEKFKVRAYHCVIEVPINGKAYTFIMGKSRKGYILTEEIQKERKDLFKLALDDIDIKHSPILDQFVEGGIKNLGKLISGFSYQSYLLWLYATCRKDKFRSIKAKSEEQINDGPQKGLLIKTRSKFAQI